MAKSVTLRQGTAAEHAGFTGQMAEVTFDTTNNTVILHDGSTPGGIPMAKLSDVPVDLTDLTDVDGNINTATNTVAFSGTTYTVTVASGTNAYSTGNKYYITDLTDASPTVTLTEGVTYRFDQSDSTNTGHPLKFSTTADGTHDSGIEYTTGVTYNGVPGQTGAYTEITVEVGAPTLYYYCVFHSGMGDAPAPAATPMWSLSGDSGSFAAVSDSKLDTSAASYVALNHPSGRGNTWALEDGSYALRNNSNLVNDPTTRPLHIWSTDDLSDGMTTQYWIKFDANQPAMWEALHGVEAGSSQAYSYSILLAYAVHTLAWAGNGAYGYFGHTSNGSSSFPDQGWLHIAEEIQSNGRQVIYINGVVVVNESASDLSGLTNKANLYIGSVSSWITDIEVYTGGGIHNPDLLATPPGFTPPTRKVAPDSVDVADVFNISTYTSSGAARSVVNDLDMATDGGMVWLKSQSVAQDHQLYDTNRGATKSLATGYPNTSEATNSTGLTAFNANGFTIGNHATINTSGEDYVAWSFKKQASFFDIQTWTGDGTNSRSLPHDLNHDVGCIMVKCTSDSTDIDQWWVWHKDLTSNSYNLTLSASTNEEANNVFHDSGPSSTHFYVSSASQSFAAPPTNGNGKTYVAYLFADNDGDGIFGTNADQDIIKCGVYTGDDTALRTIDIGFEAQFIITKKITTGGQYDHWKIHDTTRGMTETGTAATLYPTLTSAEQFFVGANWAQVNSAGWSTGAGQGYENASGAKYIYIAIKKE